MKKTYLYVFRAPEAELTGLIREQFQSSSQMISEQCTLIAAGTKYAHTRAGHVMGDRIEPQKFIATSKLDLHPSLMDISPMEDDQQEWFRKIPKDKTNRLWAETLRIVAVVKKICEEHEGGTVIVLIDNRIVDAVTTKLRTSKINGLEELAEVKQEHLDMIAVKLSLNGGEGFFDEVIAEPGSNSKTEATLLEPVKTPRWPGEFNPVW